MPTRSWNKAELIGNLTRDPELRFTPSGAAVCTFSIATNRTYMVDGERKEEVDFHRIVCWNKLAELCGQLLKKGTRVFVSGRLQNRSWEGQDGAQRQVTEIVIEDMIILTNKGASSEASEDVSADLPTEPSPRAAASESKVSTDANTEDAGQKTEELAQKSEEASSDEPVREPVKQEVVNDDDLPF